MSIVRRPWHRLGRVATADADFTTKLLLDGLAPSREYDLSLRFEDEHGRRGETGMATFCTATLHPAATSFIWTGDNSGQG